MFLNVYLLSEYVYTPPQICVYPPPNFKFLEITMAYDAAYLLGYESG